MFVTLLLGAFDVTAGRLTYIRAGHLAPFLRRASDYVERLPGSGGLPLGLMEDAVYTRAAVDMHSGEGVLVITDGISEATDPSSNLFGEAPVTELLARSGKRGRELLDLMLSRAQEFEGPCTPADDKAALLLELRT
jgi:sigma-B regulation protein RsbU (phosphoserine phosphatase)